MSSSGFYILSYGERYANTERFVHELDREDRSRKLGSNPHLGPRTPSDSPPPSPRLLNSSLMCARSRDTDKAQTRSPPETEQEDVRKSITEEAARFSLIARRQRLAPYAPPPARLNQTVFARGQHRQIHKDTLPRRVESCACARAGGEARPLPEDQGLSARSGFGAVLRRASNKVDPVPSEVSEQEAPLCVVVVVF